MHKQLLQWVKFLGVLFCGTLLILGSSGGGPDGGAVGPSPAAPSTVATGVITAAAGGTVSFPAGSQYTGTSIAIPAGALAADTTITVTASNPTINGSQIGFTFIITPHGTTFNTPVTVTLTFDPNALPAGTVASQLQLIKQDTLGNQTTGANIVVNMAQGTISGTFTSLSDFAAVLLPNNVPPIANAGTNQNVASGSIVQLNGSASTDADGNPLTYRWAINTMPVGSVAALSDPYAINPTFIADQPGTYGVQLIVNDGTADSAPATITITATQQAPGNTAPIANAGISRTITYGSTVQLNGSASTDAEANPLTYRWTLTARPAGSIARLSDPYAVAPTFVADRVGSFTVQLIVNDGAVDSAPATITLTVPQPAAPSITAVDRTTASIGDLITITGGNLLSPAGELPQISLNKRGGGTINAPIASATVGTAKFTVPSDVVSGSITVTQLGLSAISATTLTITASNSFTLTAGPAAVHLLPANQNQPLFDYSSIVNTTLHSNNGFTQLATLAVRGLPAGVSVAFDPPQITAGQQARIVLRAPAGQPQSLSTMIIDAYATIEGINVTQSATVDLYVDAPSTSFIGKTVVNDTQETPIAGVTVTMLGQDGYGNANACAGSTVSDAGGNFALTNLPGACAGTQLVHYDGNTATSPAGPFASVQLRYLLRANEVVASPVLVHLPQMSTGETVSIRQNWATDQVFSFQSEPNLEVRVYAGTTFTLEDGSQPDPFIMTMLRVAIDRLPGEGPAGMGMPIILPRVVAFQPANTETNLPISITYANELNRNPGTSTGLVTLDPTQGMMVQYGSGTISADGTQIIPDIIPLSEPYSNGMRRYGIMHLDWHGGAVPPPPVPQQNPDDPPPPCEKDRCGDCIQPTTQPLSGGGANSPSNPVDLSSGVGSMKNTDMASAASTRGASSRGSGSSRTSSFSITRNYRTLSTNTGAYGVGSTHNYDYFLDTSAPNALQIINLILPNGSWVPFNPDGTGSWVNSTVPSMIGARISISSNNRITLRWRDASVFTFRAGLVFGRSLLESIADKNGNMTTITRNNAIPRQILSISDPIGRKFKMAYDAASRITSISDLTGRKVTYAYNTMGTLASMTDPYGSTTKYGYISTLINGQTQPLLKTITDANQNVTVTNIYDNNGRVSKQTFANGGVLQINYSLANPSLGSSPVLKSSVTDQAGRKTSYRFNPSGIITDATDTLGQTISYKRQVGTNQMLQITGKALCSSCGSVGNKKMSQLFDPYGNRISRTNALGNSTTFAFDKKLNLPTRITTPLGNTMHMTYDAVGNLKSMLDSNANTTRFAYNKFGQIQSAIDASGQQSTLKYDGGGNVIGLIDPAGHRTSLRYDATGRLIERLNAKGQVVSKSYDILDRVTSVTDAMGNTTRFSYDALGNVLSVSDARGNSTSFAYDNMNRLIKRTDSTGAFNTRTYDLVGNLLSYTDRRGQTQNFTYDVLDRLIRVDYPDGSNVQFHYDAVSRLIEVVDSVSGTMLYGYDAANRLTQTVSPSGTINYQYDAAGRLIQRQVVGQSPLDYVYDAVGNLLSATMPVASTNFTYNKLNQPVRQTRSNGVTTDYAFDVVGNLTSIIHKDPYGAVIESINYNLDAIGNRTGRISGLPQPLQTPTAASVVDAVSNRLMNYGQSAFSYDANGNRLTETDAAGVTNYQWDARNRLASISKADGSSTQFTYDFAGNMVEKVELDAAGAVLVRESYLIDVFRNVVQLSNSRIGVKSVLSLVGIDSHLAVIDGTGQVEFGLRDGLNSTVATVDGLGNTMARFAYEPFGGTTAGSEYPFQFTGRTPVGGGLYYYRARFYDTGTGQFISEDPIGFGGGDVNLYRYVWNGVGNFADPLGEKGFKEFIEDLFDFSRAGDAVNFANCEMGLLPCDCEKAKKYWDRLNQRDVNLKAVQAGIDALSNAQLPWGGRSLLTGAVINASSSAAGAYATQ